jgi:hypothetical protein
MVDREDSTQGRKVMVPGFLPDYRSAGDEIESSRGERLGITCFFFLDSLFIS